MKTNKAGLDLIKEFEGKRLHAYKDPVGIWTIGYGHTTAAGPPAVVPGMVITDAEATAILARDLEKTENQVETAVTVPLTSNQASALNSFTFNLGTGNLQESTLLKRLNSGDYDIGNEFLKYNKGRVNGVLKVLPGLVRRRQAEKELWESKIIVQPEQQNNQENQQYQHKHWFVSFLESIQSVFLYIFGGKK